MPPATAAPHLSSSVSVFLQSFTFLPSFLFLYGDDHSGVWWILTVHFGGRSEAQLCLSLRKVLTTTQFPEVTLILVFKKSSFLDFLDSDCQFFCCNVGVRIKESLLILERDTNCKQDVVWLNGGETGEGWLLLYSRCTCWKSS